jgi:ABC-2 type transport system ATP-binding protein
MAVKIESVTKNFGAHRAVDSVSVEIPEGAIYGFIGPNGSGKTTTMRMIMNIIYPDQGSIEVFGEHRRGSATDFIGYLPEERGLYKKMKLREVLRFYGDLKGGQDVAANVDYWLDRLELMDWANEKVEALSKGMSQKAQFIATVAARPRLVILDEPFSGLDPVNTNVLLDAILELRNQGCTIIFSTHDMNTAERVCDYIFMIHKGRKVLDGTLADIQSRYAVDTIQLRCDIPITQIGPIPGINHIQDFGQEQELRLEPDADAQDVLKYVMSKVRVNRYQLMTPTLHDIFVRIAGSNGEAAA